MAIVNTANLVSLFQDRVAADGEMVAMLVRRGKEYASLTWNDLATDVRRMAALLVRLGVRPGDRVIQVSENRYEWIVTDLAILLARGVHVPVHAILTGPQIAYQISDSGASVVLLSGGEQVEKLAAELDKQSSALTLLSYDPSSASSGGHPIGHLPSLLAEVDPAEGAELERQALQATRPGDLATILYTSGTTGEPKGVMLTHGNLASNAQAVVSAFSLHEGDLRLSWLPLSHIFARTCDLYAWIISGIQLALADSRETVIANCAEVHPTLLNGVPYFFEKVMRCLVEERLADKPGSLRGILGGRVRLCCSGGAALPDHIAAFYRRHDVLLVQGYGLTECSPVMTLCTESAHKLGSVGRPPAGIEVVIADDGEVLTRGPHVMLGYWNKPQATADAIGDGWLHSGDLGEFDADGFLRITGRKKELIVTSGGKKVAPVYVESLLTEDPLILQALIVGDARSFLTALIVVDLEPLRAELAQRGIHDCRGADWLQDPRIVDLYRERIERRLAVVSEYEQVRKFTLLAEPFTPERDELTPTLKLRRNVIGAHYVEAIERMYAR